MSTSMLKSFYDREYLGQEYCTVAAADHAHYGELQRFVEEYKLWNKKCLEIGCGRGIFQDVVEDYTGVDISASVRPYLHKAFYEASATDLPFPDNAFDAIWTLAVLEHVPDPERALNEMRRVLRPNGLLLLGPAWQCRSWAADGYAVRPYSDFGLKGRITKASIPLRNSVLFRSMYVLPTRMSRYLQYAISRRPLRFRYKELKPNYERFWVSDSDAVNSMDPYEAILWFQSRGEECLSYHGWLSQFLVRTGGIVFRICKTQTSELAPATSNAAGTLPQR